MKLQKNTLLWIILLGFCTFFYVKFNTNWNNLVSQLDLIVNNSKEYSKEIVLTINGQVRSLDASANDVVVEFTSLNTVFEVPVVFTYSEEFDVSMDGIPMPSGETVFYRFERIEPDLYIPIHITNKKTRIDRSFSIRTFPLELPPYRTTGKSPFPGNYYITPFIRGGALYEIDSDGRIVFYRYSPDTAYFDFKKTETSDGIRYIYCEPYRSQHSPKAYTSAVEYVILDGNYNEIKRLKMELSKKIIDDRWPTDQHDILYISDNEYYLMAYVNKNVTNIPESIPQKEYGALVTATI